MVTSGWGLDTVVFQRGSTLLYPSSASNHPVMSLRIRCEQKKQALPSRLNLRLNPQKRVRHSPPSERDTRKRAYPARMVELVDAPDLGSGPQKRVRVRPPLLAPLYENSSMSTDLVAENGHSVVIFASAPLGVCRSCASPLRDTGGGCEGVQHGGVRFLEAHLSVVGQRDGGGVARDGGCH